MSRQIPEAKGNEKLVANKFGVATRTRLLNKIYVATLSKSVATESKNKPREKVTTEDCMLRQRPTTKTENSVMIELSMSRQSDQFVPELWGSTTQLLKCSPTLESL